MQSSWFFLHEKHVKKSAFQNKRIAVCQLAFRARRVLGTFEKQTTAPTTPENNDIDLIGLVRKNNRAARAARTLV